MHRILSGLIMDLTPSQCMGTMVALTSGCISATAPSISSPITPEVHVVRMNIVLGLYLF